MTQDNANNAKTIFEKNPKTTISIALLFIFVIIDFVTGLIIIPHIESEISPFYHHELKKNYHRFIKWQYKYEIHTNSLGFKDSSNRKVDLHTNKYRILFIGDSFTEGSGYSFEKTFSGIVSANLDETKFEILNAGVRSYSPKLYFLKVKYLIETAGLIFHEIYVFVDIADPQDEIVYESFNPDDSNPMLIKVYTFLKQRSFCFYLYHFYKDRKNWTATIDAERLWEDKRKEAPLWTHDDVIFKKWGKKGLRFAEDNMNKLYELCKKHKIRMNIAVYPWPEQIQHREFNSRQVIFWKEFAQERYINFINFFPDFINNENPEKVIDTYFIKDDIHWNDKGHYLIANRILNNYRSSNH